MLNCQAFREVGFLQMLTFKEYIVVYFLRANLRKRRLELDTRDVHDTAEVDIIVLLLLLATLTRCNSHVGILIGARTRLLATSIAR
jgi:hypothetical protein